jgi:hypothetical protein
MYFISAKWSQTPTLNILPSSYCDVLGVQETPFGLLICFITTSLVVTKKFCYNVRSSLLCWVFILVGPLIVGFLVAALIWFLWSPLLFCVSDLILLGFYSLPPWNRALAPRIEDTLSKGNFSSSTQLWLVLLRNPTIRSLFIVAGRRYLSRCIGIPSRWLAMPTSVLVM